MEKRSEICLEYDKSLSDFNIRLPERSSENFSSNHLYCIELLDAKKRRIVFNKMRASGIGVNVHYIPIHIQPFYRTMGFTEGMYPNAESYYKSALTLPIHPGIDKQEQIFIINTLRQSLNE